MLLVLVAINIDDRKMLAFSCKASNSFESWKRNESWHHALKHKSHFLGGISYKVAQSRRAQDVQ